MQPFTVTVEDACFCHWPVEADELRASVPDWLTLETFAGSAWLTAIPHGVAGIAAAGVDLVRPADAVTVRTYVRGPTDQRGLYFFAVIPDAPLVAATPVLGLPVRRGQLTRPPTDDHQSRRGLALDGQRVLDVRYAPTGDASPAPPDSLASFLVERHRFFTTGALGVQLVGSVGHDPWPVAPVEATVQSSLSAALDLPAPVDDPLVQYSPGLELSVGPPEPVWLA